MGLITSNFNFYFIYAQGNLCENYDKYLKIKIRN
jgi:hypothetical protein